MPIFSDLSYNNKTLKPIGRPVDDLKALYKEKKEDYITAIDGSNTTKTLLNQVPYDEKDAHLVDNVKGIVNDTFNKFEEEGDWENKILDVKRLSNDVVNKYGLLKVQNNKLAIDSYAKDLQAKVDKGEISVERMNDAMEYSRKHYEGVKLNKQTGTFTGTFTGRSVGPTINVPKELLAVMNGFKSNKYPWEGGTLIRNPKGNGYLIAGTTTEVSEEEIRQASLNYLKSNDLIQGQFEEDLFYEIDKKNGIEVSDVQEALRGRTTDGIKHLLGIDYVPSTEEIQTLLEDKGISAEKAYKEIRKEQKADEAMQAVIIKEGFRQDDVNYLRDYQLENAGKTPKIEPPKEIALMTVNKIGTTQRVSPEDMTNIKKGVEDTKASLQNNKIAYNTLKRKIDNGEDYSEEEFNTLKDAISKDNRILENLERQKTSISSFVEEQANIDTEFLYGSYSSAVDEERYKRSKKYFEDAEKKAELTRGINMKNESSIQSRRDAARKKAHEEVPKMSYKAYHDESIYKYTQNDYKNNVLGSVNSRTHDFDSSTRHVASIYKDKIGGKLEEQKLTEDVYTFVTDEDTEKKSHEMWNGYVNVMNTSFKQSPENFTNNGQDFTTLVDTELDVDYDDVDLSKTKVIPLIENVNGKPAYAIEVYEYTTDAKTKSIRKGKVLVNFEGSAYGQEEVVKKIATLEAAKYIDKLNNGTLTGHDLTIFRKLAQNYINSSPAGKALDDLNIYTAEPGVALDWKILPNLSVDIVPKKSQIKEGDGVHINDLVYELHDKQGRVYGKNEKGQDVWDYSNNLTNTHLFDNPYELKEVVGSSLLKNEIQPTPLNTNNTINPGASIDINKVIKAESNNNASAINEKSGATGLMQILPIDHPKGSPLLDWNKANVDKQYTSADLTNPAINKEVGVWYLNKQIPYLLENNNIPDNSVHRLMAYNWGIENVRKWYESGSNWDAVPDETRNYVIKILR